MLSLPDAIAEAIRERSGKYAPAMFLDIYSDTGPMDEIGSTSRWLGTNDPAVVNDVNVDAERRRGAITLAAGTPVTPTTPASYSLLTTMSATIRRTDKYHYKGTIGKLGGSAHAYDGTDFLVTKNDTQRYQAFTVPNTEIIDDITVAARYTGYQAMVCTVKLVSASTGNQVGNAINFTPTASVTQHALTGFKAGVVAGRAYRVEITARVPSQIGVVGGPPSVTTNYTCNVELYGMPGDGNLLIQSETLQAWSGSAIVTPNTASYNGNMVADKCEDNSASWLSKVQGIAIDPSMTYSVWVRVKKDAIPKTTRFSLLRYQFVGGVTEQNNLNFASDTGEFGFANATADAQATIITDPIDVNYWLIGFSATTDDPANTSLNVTLYPAVGVWSGWWSWIATTTGWVEVFGFQSVKGKTISTIPAYISTTTVAKAAIPDAWRIHMGNGYYWATGGQPNYQTTGSTTRSIDVGEIPVDNGVISISDVIPSGCTMNIAAYYTDSDVIAAETAITNWTLFSSTVVSGVGVPGHRYWRFIIDMTSNVAQDLAPQAIAISVRYIPDPVIIGTTATRERLQLYNGLALPVVLPLTWKTNVRLLQKGFKALNKVSSSSASLSPQFNSSMVGNVSADCAPEPIMHDLVNKYLRGKRVDVRAGYVGVDDTLKFYSGSINDFSFANNMYKLSIADNFKMADVSIPSEKAGDEWDALGVYSINDVVVFGDRSYICIVAVGPTATTPDADPTHWTDNGSVWLNIDYTSTTSPDSPADWHLADIITDILTNQINIPNERIDFASIAAVKTALPDRRGTRLINKPNKATTLLGELAWLLESQFIVREGLFALMQESAADEAPVESIGPNDIAPNSLTYRRGWSEMLNQGVIITGYSGDGDGSDKFSKGEVIVDTTSQVNYGTVIQKSWEDRWNCDATELQGRLTSMNSKYADGRKVFSCTTTMRLLAVEPGDVIVLSSGQLPPGDAGPINCFVISKKLDFAKQTIQFTMLEA